MIWEQIHIVGVCLDFERVDTVLDQSGPLASCCAFQKLTPFACHICYPPLLAVHFYYTLQFTFHVPRGGSRQATPCERKRAPGSEATPISCSGCGLMYIQCTSDVVLITDQSYYIQTTDY